MAQRIAVQAAKVTGGRSRQLLVPAHLRQHHPLYGQVRVTPERVERFAESFRQGVKTYGGRLPFSIDHDTSRGAAGWITGVDAEAAGLYADIEWTPSGVEAIESQQYPFISPEWLDEWTDPASGEKHRDVFEGASLVVRPQFRELPPATVQHFAEDPEPTVIVWREGEEQVSMDEDQVQDEATDEDAGDDAGATVDEQGSADEAERGPEPPAHDAEAAAADGESAAAAEADGDAEGEGEADEGSGEAGTATEEASEEAVDEAASSASSHLVTREEITELVKAAVAEALGEAAAETKRQFAEVDQRAARVSESLGLAQAQLDETAVDAQLGRLSFGEVAGRSVVNPKFREMLRQLVLSLAPPQRDQAIKVFAEYALVPLGEAGANGAGGEGSNETPEDRRVAEQLRLQS